MISYTTPVNIYFIDDSDSYSAPNELEQQTNKKIRDVKDIERQQTNLQDTRYMNGYRRPKCRNSWDDTKTKKNTFLPGFSSSRKIFRKSNSSTKERAFKTFRFIENIK